MFSIPSAPPCRNFHLGGDGVGLVHDVGGVTGRQAERFTRVGEDGLAGSRAGPWRSRASGEAVIQREHVVFLRLGQEEFLHVAHLVGHLGGEVVILRIILGDVVELPLVAVDHVGKLAQAQKPGWPGAV